MSLTGLGSLFSGGGVKVFMPNLSGGINGANPTPPDPRTNFTGGLSNIGAPTQGDVLGPQGNNNQSTELASHYGFSGYYPPPMQTAPQTPMGHPNLSITQLQPFQQTSPAVNIAPTIAAHMQSLQKPPEPTHTYSTEGEWGGGITGGAGAPQQFGQTWLQSANGGANWSPQYGVKGTLGQAPSGGWAQMNNGGSSPQWIQRG